MLPFARESVTLIRRTETKDKNNRTRVAYAKKTLSGCSWRRTTRMVRDGSAVVPVEGITCRIPAGLAEVHAGDLLVRGTVTEEVTSGADYQKIVERCRDSDGAFVAASVSDNAREGYPAPHIAVRS